MICSQKPSCFSLDKAFCDTWWVTRVEILSRFVVCLNVKDRFFGNVAPLYTFVSNKVITSTPVADIIKSHDLQYHFYADDTQLYITFKIDSADDACLAKSRVEHCVEEIDRWMILNKLKLNDDKTQLIVFSSKYRPRPHLSKVQIGSECMEQSNTVRNLGVLFDQTPSFGEHVSKLYKSSHYHLRNISKIRKYLDENSTETLVHAFVSSKLDYCNALLIGLQKYQIDRL